MLRNITLAVAGIATAIILAPSAQAAPKMCDNHGTGPGQIYIHACAGGGGGGGGQGWTPIDPDERAAQLAHINDVMQQVQDRLNGG